MKILQRSLAALGSFSFLVQKALATSHTVAPPVTAPASGGGGGKLSVPNIPGLTKSLDIKAAIVSIVVAVLDFVLLIAVVFVIVAGIRLIISGGEDGEKDKAKKTIIYVIAGIIIILLARVIVVFVAGLV